MHDKKGFSLIELLVVMGILAIIVPASIPIYSGLQVSSQLNENVAQAIQTIRLAREYSRAGLNNGAYGVFFEINAEAQDKFILYKGDSYVSRDADYDQIAILDAAVVLTTALQGNEINFAQGSGTPSVFGELFFASNNGGQKTIVVNQEGFVMLN